MMYNTPGFKWKLHYGPPNAHPLYPKTSAVANRIIEKLDQLEYLYCVRINEDHYDNILDKYVPGNEIHCYWFVDNGKDSTKYEIDLSVNPEWSFVYQDIKWAQILEEELTKLNESIEEMLTSGIRVKQEVNGKTYYTLPVINYSI